MKTYQLTYNSYWGGYCLKGRQIACLGGFAVVFGQQHGYGSDVKVSVSTRKFKNAKRISFKKDGDGGYSYYSIYYQTWRSVMTAAGKILFRDFGKQRGKQREQMALYIRIN